MMVVNDRHTKSPMSSGTSQNLKSRRSPQHLEAASVKILPRRVRIVKLGEPCSAGHYSSLNVAERPASVSVLAGIYKHAISIIEIRRVENEALTFLCKSVLGDPTQPLLIMPNMGNYSFGLPTEVLRSPSIYPHIPPRSFEDIPSPPPLDPTSQMCLPYLASHLLPYAPPWPPSRCVAFPTPSSWIP